MNKLQQGDYVTDLTDEQFRELERIEGEHYAGVLMFKDGSINHLLFNGRTLVHAHLYYNPKTKLTFNEFRERAINTFRP